ncbi:hypothetical protein DKM19_27425 [Streptosporangium sp. 'caverna']|nr:hypothetical protein DKM19_27425 [Streptosporangium sp. 'caverna']
MTAGVCAVPAVAKESKLRAAQNIRALVGIVRVDGRDKSDIGKDDYIHEPRAVDRLLIENQDTLIPEVHDYRWGGECRVEIDMHARLLPPRDGASVGNIDVWGQARFYEGDSESTNELEDSKNFSFSVPQHFRGGASIRYVVDMKNPVLIGGDDWAVVTFELKNRSPE